MAHPRIEDDMSVDSTAASSAMLVRVFDVLSTPSDELFVLRSITRNSVCEQGTADICFGK